MSTSQSTQQAMNHLGDSERPLATPEAGKVRSYWSWLLFKEAKQLAPIVIALAACGFVLHLLSIFQPLPQQAPIHITALLMVPFLFAIGAGPMLVSQEKEQRTLGWLGSLPVGPRSIVLSKLIVCVLGLMLSWIVSIALTGLLAPQLFRASSSITPMDILQWIFATFAVLSLGFALAWKFPTAISSLIALVVSCSVATLVGRITLSMIVDTEGFDRQIEMAGLGLFSLAIAAAAVLYAQRAFVAGSGTESFFSVARWGTGSNQRHFQQDRPTFWTQSPSSSLIWQISRQNNLIWSGLLLIVVMSGALLLYYRFNRPTEADLVMAYLLPVGLVFSWLGASVFGSDAYRERINFLAQRGVAPGLIWWTRMILPLGSVCVGLLVFFLLFWLPPKYPFSTDSSNLPKLMVVLGGLVIFAYTQWFSQWTRSTLIGFCVAPAVAAMAIGYMSFVLQFFEAPWWILLPSIGVALLASRIMLSPWMDRRFDLRYWTSHGALLLAALAIPLLPFLYAWATHPDMPSAMKRSLAAEVRDYQRSARPAPVLLESNRDGSLTDDTTGEFASSINDWIEVMEQRLAVPNFQASSDDNRFALTTADLLSLRMEAMTDSGESTDREQADNQRYRRIMLILENLVRRLRQSEKLHDQRYADLIERWLVSEMSRSDRQEIFPEQQYARIVAGLADQDARNQARRRAIVMAWHESTTQRNHQFGNVSRPSEPSEPKITFGPSWLVEPRHAGVAAAELLEHLESSTPTPISYPGKLTTVNFDALPDLGMLWHRPWETKAKQLAESLKSTPATKGNDDE